MCSACMGCLHIDRMHEGMQDHTSMQAPAESHQTESLTACLVGTHMQHHASIRGVIPLHACGHIQACTHQLPQVSRLSHTGCLCMCKLSAYAWTRCAAIGQEHHREPSLLLQCPFHTSCCASDPGPVGLGGCLHAQHWTALDPIIRITHASMLSSMSAMTPTCCAVL